MAKDDDFPSPTHKDATKEIPQPPKPTEVAENMPKPPAPPAPPLPDAVKKEIAKNPDLPDVDVPPRVLDYLFEEAPDKVAHAVEEDTARLMALPAKIDRDLATLLVFIAHEPRKVVEDLYEAPGEVPGQTQGFVETVREGMQYGGDQSEKSRGERLRRITDLIDLFTPT